MSDRNPALRPILAMEEDIRTVQQIGRLLMYLGEREGEIEAEALNALIGPLMDAGQELRAQYVLAIGAAREEQA